MISIAICNAKGGVAKTTTALSLASFLSMKNKRVLLIDLDPQANSTRTLLKLEIGKKADKPNMYDVIYQYVMEAKKNILRETIRKVNENLSIAPANFRMEQFKDMIKIHSREPIHILTELVKPIRKDFDYLILDCPPDLSAYVENAIKLADFLLLPTTYDDFGLDALSYIIPVILDIKSKKFQNYKVIYTLFNSRATKIQEELESFEEELNDLEIVLPYRIPIDQKVRNWQATRIDFMTHKDYQKSKAKLAYEELGNYILKEWN
jgi:chromosome partitioning protein